MTVSACLIFSVSHLHASGQHQQLAQLTDKTAINKFNYQPRPSKSNYAEALIQAKGHLAMMVFRIKAFHHEAKSTLRSSLNLTLYKEYFALPESAKNHFNKMGDIQLTNNQHQIRKKMESWILSMHNRFPIGETCLIDKTGQEHMRVVGGKIEKPHLFSHEESDAPFFAPSFKKNKGEIYFSKPYMSSDSYQWVIAYTSPIIMDDGSKPAFYHFEVPLSIYKKFISTTDFRFLDGSDEYDADVYEEGRYFIVSTDKLLIADSQQTINYILPDSRHPEKNDDLPDYLPPEKINNYIPHVSSISKDPNFLNAVDKLMKQKSGDIKLNIKNQEYVLISETVPDKDWMIFHLDPIGKPGFWAPKKK
jgi:hypothetical protein